MFLVFFFYKYIFVEFILTLNDSYALVEKRIRFFFIGFYGSDGYLDALIQNISRNTMVFLTLLYSCNLFFFSFFLLCFRSFNFIRNFSREMD